MTAPSHPVTPRPDRRVDLSETIRTARERIAGSKRVYLMMAGFYIVLIGVVGALLAMPIATMFFPTEPGAEFLDPRADAILVAFIAAAAAPFQGGFQAAGLTRVAGAPIRFGMLFERMNLFPRFFGLTLLIGLIGVITATWGFAGTLVSLAVSMFLSFAGFYLVDRDLQLGEAMTRSSTAVAANLRAVALFFLLSAALGLLVVVTIGLALPWIIPFTAVGTATMYAHVEGIGQKDDAAKKAEFA